MKPMLSSLLLAGALLLPGASASAALLPGSPAPNFTLTDTTGHEVTLEAFRGKVVVLEWTNPNCPFVRKQYTSKKMQDLQKKYTAQGVIWLQVNSSAPGEDGDFTPAETNRISTERGAAPTAILPDRAGTVGHLYDAKSTPHMFIISKTGNVVYNGAIDSIKSNKPADVPLAQNYVALALDELLAGKDVTISAAVPYGCFVHYSKAKPAAPVPQS